MINIVNIINTEKLKNFNINIKLNFKKNLRNLILLLMIIIMISIFSIIKPIFISLQSMMNMVNAISVLSIGALAMSLAILVGGLDLSIGSSLGLSAVCAALVVNITNNPFLGFITAILVASSVGFFNGILIGKLKINTIILTLGMLSILRSLDLVFSNNDSIRVNNKVFNWIGGHVIATNRGNIPVSIFLILFLYLLLYLLLNNTVLGRRFTAIGVNNNAAKTAGIIVDKNIILIYLLIGFFIGVGSIVEIGIVSSATVQAGVGLEFDAVTAVVLGGASLNGGKLDIKSTFLGVFLIGVIINGMALLNIYVYAGLIFKGLLLLFAIFLNNLFDKFQVEY